MNTQPKKHTFDKEVERVLESMKTIDVGSEEYRKSLDDLNKLCEARALKAPNHISMDTIINASANILGILLVLNFEKLGIVTSKAFGLIGRRG